MAWDKRPQKHSWRDYLTKEEAAELAEIDRDAEKIDLDRRHLTARRAMIVNRAIQRAKYSMRSTTP